MVLSVLAVWFTMEVPSEVEVAWVCWSSARVDEVEKGSGDEEMEGGPFGPGVEYGEFIE